MKKSKRNPIRFQGKRKRKKYFEGWYFKNVSEDKNTVVSLIPGISLFDKDPHCFIQYIIYRKGFSTKTGYIRYPKSAFYVHHDPFYIQIDKNIFSESLIEINLQNQDVKIDGLIQLDELTPIKTSTWMPDIMGVFSYIPKMQCNHGIVSMNHSLGGHLMINDQEISFKNGKGYIEKDWGSSFPKAYVWIHSNHFENESMSLFCSIAHIPFASAEFTGYICNLIMNGKEYRLATYTKSKLHIHNITSNKIRFELENKSIHIDVNACLTESAPLTAPNKGQMKNLIKEGLCGNVIVTIKDKKKPYIYHQKGMLAGIEIVGDISSS